MVLSLHSSSPRKPCNSPVNLPVPLTPPSPLTSGLDSCPEPCARPQQTQLQTFVSQGNSSDPISWRLFAQTSLPALTSPMPSFTSTQSPRPRYLPSPLLSNSDTFSGAGTTMSYQPPSNPVPTTLPGTPPGSVRSDSADGDTIYRDSQMYTPQPSSEEYARSSGNVSPTLSGHESYSYDGHRSARVSPSRQSPDRHMRHEHSYSPYPYEKRQSYYQSREYRSGLQMPSLREHETIPRIMSNDLLPLPISPRAEHGLLPPASRIMLPPTSTHPSSTLPFSPSFSDFTNSTNYYEPRRPYEPRPYMDIRNDEHEQYDDPFLGGGALTVYRCQQCPYTDSSKDQVRKHQQKKHMKIHRCDVPGCPRTEGFATPNDLVRHKKSLHKVPGVYWRCLSEDCSSYNKIFSRRDNLMDHLRRMHPIPDGLTEVEASKLRSKIADSWRVEKRDVTKEQLHLGDHRHGGVMNDREP